MWWSQRTGGRSALDYLIKVRGYSFLEAVELLAERANIQQPLSVSENVPIEKQLLLVWIWKPGRVVCLLCVMVCRPEWLYPEWSHSEIFSLFGRCEVV